MVHGYFSNHSVNLCKELLNYTEVFDFTRCVRPDSTSYGTGGKCRKGVEEEKEKDTQTSTLTQKESEVVDKYIKEINRVWPDVKKEDLKEAVKNLTQKVSDLESRSRSGEITFDEIDNLAKKGQLPSVSKSKTFMIIGMEPGGSSGDPHKSLALSLAKLQVGEKFGNPELAEAAFHVVNSVRGDDNAYSKNVIGTEPKAARGHTFPKQLKIITDLVGSHDPDLRAEQVHQATAFGNIRSISAPGIGVKGVYEAINSQKDPKLKQYGREESGVHSKERNRAIYRSIMDLGSNDNFEGGVMAPGMGPKGGKKKGNEDVLSFVQGYRNMGGQVVTFTAMMGAKADTPVSTHSLVLPNGKPFVVVESSLNNQKLAGSNLRRVYNDVLVNFYKETGKEND